MTLIVIDPIVLADGAALPVDEVLSALRDSPVVVVASAPDPASVRLVSCVRNDSR